MKGKVTGAIGRADCICGASLTYQISGFPGAAEAIVDIFWQQHQGEGHGSCTKEEAARARRRREQEEHRLALEEERQLELEFYNGTQGEG